jgi:hypothetical protein
MMGAAVAIDNPPLMFITIPAGIIVVGSAMGVNVLVHCNFSIIPTCSLNEEKPGYNGHITRLKVQFHMRVASASRTPSSGVISTEKSGAVVF